MAEIYYAAAVESQKLSLEQLAERFAAAGLPCKIEPEAENMYWLAFESRQSNVLASVEDGKFVFGTFNFCHDDPSSVAEIVDEVLTSVGFSADDEPA